MPVIFKCKCGQYFTAANSLINKDFVCVKCQTTNQVPNPFSSEIEEDALHALFSDETNEEDKESVLFDKSLRCQNCGARVTSDQANCNLCGSELSQ